MIWLYVGIVTALLSLLAFHWEYETTMWDRRARRNKQWMLIVMLLMASLLSFIKAWDLML